ncbi:MAG: adenylosuccinate lyase [Cyanobacteria bacterium]|nr:adenylosuccinate lyase [Cyanobacteriota bacterium]
MIKRYTRPVMGALWQDESKYASWLEVEIAACEAQAQLGMMPSEAVEEIRARAKFNVDRILEIEEEVKHDVIAFLTNVNENVGDVGRYIHKGMTSSDVLDTALSLQLKKASELLSTGLSELIEAITSQVKKHKQTLMVGRSHGIHAEPMTFGFKLAVWLEELRRHQKRLHDATEMISVGKFSGAVGTFSNITPEVEAKACEILGLTPAPISTQIIQRDRHAQYLWTLAVIGSSLEKFATEIRHLQKTDVLEAEEPFTVGQKGSSAMPHKRNPVGSENITGLARILRANSLAALENIPLWHERDISHSSVERVIIPDSTILLDYMLHRFTRIMKDIVVYPENMARNMDIFGGVIFSQAVMLKLVEKGLSRESAYEIVQSNAMNVWNKEGGSFREHLKSDQRVKEHLTTEEVDDCLNPENYLKNINAVFERLGV